MSCFSGYDQTFNVQPQPIQFLEEPTDHVTLAGADVTFVCSTTVLMSDGLSDLHTTWLHNNNIIQSGHHYIISHNGNSTLTLKNVTSDDQGIYHCIVDDWRTKIRSRNSHLNGKCSITQRLNHVKVCCVFLISVVKSKNHIAFINATLGSTITLPCSTPSGRKPTWYKDKEVYMHCIAACTFVTTEI